MIGMATKSLYVLTHLAASLPVAIPLNPWNHQWNPDHNRTLSLELDGMDPR